MDYKFLAASLTAGFASLALAQDKGEQPYRPPPPTIIATPFALAVAGFDRDGDAQVSRVEYDAGVKRSFSQGDQDGSGSIGLIELSAWAQATLGNATALPGAFDFDRDGDDKISSTEFTALFARRFVEMDVNKDGQLSRSELVTLISNPMHEQPRRQRRGGSEQEQGRQSPPR